MSTPFLTTSAALRLFLLIQSGLVSERPARRGRTNHEEVLQTVRSLECVQIDPVAAVERNQHLVLGARLPGYSPEMLNDLLEGGQVFEYMANAACVIPMEDFPMFRSTRRRIRTHLKAELSQYKKAADDVLARLDADGPLPAKAFDSDHRVHGYWDNQSPKTKVTSHVLNLLMDTLQIRVVRREGNTRYFDLTEKSVPLHLLQAMEDMEDEDSKRLLFEKYMRAYRVFDLADPRFGWHYYKAVDRKTRFEPYVQSGRVIPLTVEGVRTSYFILAEDLDLLEQLTRDGTANELPTTRLITSGLKTSELNTGPQTNKSVALRTSTVRFLPPLDNLLWRRPRLVDLFSFEYKWEIYTPANKRQYGYYAMPILMGDRLIGRIDPKLNRKQKTLVVEGLQIEPTVRVTKGLKTALGRGIKSFARFHGAKEVIGAEEVFGAKEVIGAEETLSNE